MEYKTSSGDTFDSIAYKFFGHRRYTKNLMEANKNYLDVVIFSSGIKLNIPEISEENSTDSAGDNLPPWRRE